MQKYGFDIESQACTRHVIDDQYRNTSKYYYVLILLHLVFINCFLAQLFQ